MINPQKRKIVDLYRDGKKPDFSLDKENHSLKGNLKIRPLTGSYSSIKGSYSNTEGGNNG